MLLPTPRPAASREILCLALFATDTHNGVAADAIALERRLLSGLSFRPEDRSLLRRYR